jgi:hypothetical protein
MLLDYHFFYGGETPPQPHHGSVVLDWFKEFQRREKEEEDRKRRRRKPVRKTPVRVSLSIDAELPAIEVYAFGRVRARVLSVTALKLAAVAEALVRAAARSDASLLPPEMRSVVRTTVGTSIDVELPQSEAAGVAELRVLLAAVGSLPDPDLAALATARISILAQNEMLRPSLLSVLRTIEPLDIDAANSGWTDDMLLIAAAELLLEDEDDEEE